MRRQFELRPMVTVIPWVPEGKDAPEILAEVNRNIDSKYGRNPDLKVLKLISVNGIQRIVGSCPLIKPIFNKIIAPQFGVMRPEEVETTLQEGDTIQVNKRYHIDYGLVLDFSGRHHELAIGVFGTLPEELRDFDRLPAIMINYSFMQ